MLDIVLDGPDDDDVGDDGGLEYGPDDDDDGDAGSGEANAVEDDLIDAGFPRDQAAALVDAVQALIDARR